MDFKKKESYTIDDLRQIMQILRAPGGCPWDAEQTHESIRKNMIEEAYEVVDAIDSGDKAALQEELGDVLMQVVFHAEMEAETGAFTLDDVADGVCKKLVYRHPHVFGNVKAETSEQVLKNWDALKLVEKSQKSNESIRASRASCPRYCVRKRCRKAPFGSTGRMQPVALIKSPGTRRNCAAAENGSAEQFEKKLGDLLFSCERGALFAHGPRGGLTGASDSYSPFFLW